MMLWMLKLITFSSDFLILLISLFSLLLQNNSCSSVKKYFFPNYNSNYNLKHKISSLKNYGSLYPMHIELFDPQIMKLRTHIKKNRSILDSIDITETIFIINSLSFRTISYFYPIFCLLFLFLLNLIMVF